MKRCSWRSRSRSWRRTKRWEKKDFQLKFSQKKEKPLNSDANSCIFCDLTILRFSFFYSYSLYLFLSKKKKKKEQRESIKLVLFLLHFHPPYNIIPIIYYYVSSHLSLSWLHLSTNSCFIPSTIFFVCLFLSFFLFVLELFFTTDSMFR